MKNFTEQLIKLIQKGEIEKAFDGAMEIAKVNNSYTTKLTVLRARYSIWDGERRKGTIDRNDNLEFNKIIEPFISLLYEIEQDFIEDNSWIKKQQFLLKEKAFPFVIDVLYDNKIAGISLGNIEVKIDRSFWYIIHWKIEVNLLQPRVLIGPTDVMEEFQKELKSNGDRVFTNSAEAIEKIGEKILEVLYEWAGLEFGLPIFHMSVHSVFLKSGPGFFVMFSTVMYSSKKELEYPWGKPL